MSQDISVYDDYNLSNVYLNLEFHPYNDLNLDFDRKRYVVLFDMYIHFREALWNQLFRNAAQRVFIYRGRTFCH